MPVDDAAWPPADAPGSPGIAPTWTSSNKDVVGTSLGPSRVWFTLGHGIINEVYYPRVDLPQIRDLGFIVADGQGFWCEIKRLSNYRLDLPAPGVPAPVVTHRHERFELTLRIVPDPRRDALLIEVALTGDESLRPYVLLAPHLGGSGWNNLAAAGRHYGRNVLWAEQGPFGLAIAASDRTQAEALGRMSAGYVGISDGWQDFAANGAMQWTHERAGPGNVALLGELDRECVLALAFGASRGAAASLALAALAGPFHQTWTEHVAAWQDWHRDCHGGVRTGALNTRLEAQFHTSRMVLRCHMDKTQPGAMVASLSIPWGNTKDDRGGYHLVWPRDLVQCGAALLGVGGEAEARDVLRYLIATQYEDGHWNQNQWLGGTPFWQGIQLDETALPVVLAALLHDHDALAGIEVADMTRRALGFIARMGPVTDQDRWEEDRGINAFTLAACIAALVAGAEFLDGDERSVALDLADDWNARIESWLYATTSPLAVAAGVAGTYIRMAPAEILVDARADLRPLAIRNREQDPGLNADEQVSGDFLQLVRFGLRAPGDSHVVDSLRVADKNLRTDTPSGPAWHRYNCDGYGERADGTEFDGTGQGRAWPLLTGERGHYAILAGNDAMPFLEAMADMAGPGGMLPEQVWDSAPIPERNLYPGKPTGSAMPLAWSHAEFVKLALSAQLRTTFDCPRAVFTRYAGRIPVPERIVWSERAPAGYLPTGRDLRINLSSNATIRWRVGGGEKWNETPTTVCLPGMYTAIIPTRKMRNKSRMQFRWEKGDSKIPGPVHEMTIRDSA